MGRRITILALGSRGDLQPLLALGVGLARAGHRVRFGGPADVEAQTVALGLDFVAISGRSADFFGGPAGMAMRDRVRDARQFNRFFEDYLGTYLDKLLAKCWDAAQGSDAVLCWSWTRASVSLAEKLKVPLFVAGAAPVLHLPTVAFANPYHDPPRMRLGPLSNRLSWRWAEPLTRIGQTQADRWRQDTLGLPKLAWRDELRQLRRLPHLFGYSPQVLPRPWDWPRDAAVTGYWHLPPQPGYAPPPELAAFLAAGEAPVAIGFSSQVSKASRRISAEVVRGLDLAGRRGVFISGFGGLRGIDLPASVLRVESVPYDWLLPRVAAMVHHGGCGSTASALCAGTPSFAVPFGYDQALWGDRIARLGVGRAPLFPDDLTATSFARALDRLLGDPALPARAQRLAERLAAEDGVGNAVRLVERAFAGRLHAVTAPRASNPALAQV